MSYWASGYWHANYWHADYWPEYVAPTVEGDYWHTGYWHVNYWADGYWALSSGPTTSINQTATPSMTLTAQVPSIDISLEVSPDTPSMTLSGLSAAVSNNVTVEATTPTMTMTAISPSQDAGEYYVADISFTVFTASSFDFTETVSVTAPSMAMTSNNTGVQVGDAVIVGVTSTPTMTLSALPTSVSNPVVVQPGTPSMAMTSLNVSTGFGTLIEATVPSLGMSALQANVVGVNADINEIDATLATMMLTEFNPTVEGVSGDTAQPGGHFLPGLVGVKAGKRKSRKKAYKDAKKVVEKIVDEVLDPNTSRVSKKRKYEIIDRAATELRGVLVGNETALDRSASLLADSALKRRREAQRMIREEDEIITLVLTSLL